MLDTQNSLIKRKIMVIFSSCLVVTILLSCAGMVAQERHAKLIVEPASGKASTIIKIKGAQFLQGEEIDIIMRVGDIYHGLGTRKIEVIVADKNGEFEVVSGIPVKTPPGVYQITAAGNRGSKASFSITVLKVK